ncbi:ABC transporter ATP-binding protein [Metabacillus fastidiosus]|uniref:ABC transporter ATP-binding protein n=1 Tax=Metabacillus fastidiosus TaxID=1458 RepID=A0ABU6NYG7_9BACI|nr:ABC transporter ATP-binding protein [Metabacillus fastidiosus]
MKKILAFTKPYRFLIIFALFLMFVELAVELVQPLLMAKIIDDGIVAKDFNMVLKWGGIMLGISLLAFISGIINSFYASHISQNFGYDIRKKLFEKVQSFSFTNLGRFETSSLITRMTNDVTQIQTTLFMSLRIMLRAPLTVIFGIALALIVNFQLGIFLAVALPLLLVCMKWIMKKGGLLFRTVQGKLDRVNGVMQENLTSMRLIKAFLRKDYEVNRFTKAANELTKGTASAFRTIEMTMPIMLLVMNVTILVVLWKGSLQVSNSEVKIGEVVAVVNYALRITSSLSMFSFIIMFFSRAKASSKRVTEVLETDVDLIDSADAEEEKSALEGKIEFQEASFKYPNSEAEVLKNVSFTVHSGETIAILGATGSGKSSLFQLIPRLYEANSGSIFIDDQEIKKYKLEHLRKQIGLVPQEAMLFSGSVQSNIMWGKEDATMDEVIFAAKNAQIHETIMALPQQYDSILGQKGINLSGGQKQRLSIARALVRNPKILLLDDSTSALDLKTEAKLLEAIKKYNCTTLIITQKISTAMQADKTLLLEDGMIIAEGTHEELMKTTKLYRKITESQFGKEMFTHDQTVN